MNKKSGHSASLVRVIHDFFNAHFSKYVSKKYCVAVIVALTVLLTFAFALPRPLFNAPYSPVFYDKDGTMLGAQVALDEQWRFPPGEVPPRFAAALILYEDKRFRRHVGIDVLALGRAFAQNIKAGKAVSGASTITMQTIRLMRKNKRRTIFEKAIEGILAVRLEISSSKEEILKLYAANAPFGGNTVGLEAAAWRYFSHSASELSWGEAAALAVLPNSPALVHPGRNRNILKIKRDRLLTMLFEKNVFDRDTLVLALAEELPAEPRPIPRLAPHLIQTIITTKNSAAGRNQYADWSWAVRTTIDSRIQSKANAVLQRRAELNAGKGIYNAACLILDTQSGEVIAYVGNVAGTPSEYVDLVQARRSSGSLLKPFLFAAMLDSGQLLPRELVSDIPTRIDSYRPENNTRRFTGVIDAGSALSRSLNIPAVRALRRYGTARFITVLKDAGITTFFRTADEYGLPLILGGGEVTLWEMSGLYAGLARQAMGSVDGFSRFFPPIYEKQNTAQDAKRVSPISTGAAWLTLDILTGAARPEEETAWQNFASSWCIAWKTGTSFGFRDAWAIGVTERWTVGVWAGNAAGEGRADLRAADTAAPILFELFSSLEASPWLPKPLTALRAVEICALSGFPAGPSCENTNSADVPQAAPARGPCPFCKTIILNERGDRQTQVTTALGERIISRKWFILPAAEEWYYRRNNLDYQAPPPAFDADSRVLPLALFNPEENSQLYVPVELDGIPGRLVFTAAHRNEDAAIFWHLDDTYLGQTTLFHETEARPEAGTHTLTLIDTAGNTVRRHFKVLN